MGVCGRLPWGTPTLGTPSSTPPASAGCPLGSPKAPRGPSALQAREPDSPSGPLPTLRLWRGQGTQLAGGTVLSKAAFRGLRQSQAFCLNLFAGIFLNAWSQGLYKVGMHIHANHMQITPPPDQLEENVSSFLPQGQVGGQLHGPDTLCMGTHTSEGETKARGRDGLARCPGMARRNWAGQPWPDHLPLPSSRGSPLALSQAEFSVGGRGLCRHCDATAEKQQHFLLNLLPRDTATNTVPESQPAPKLKPLPASAHALPSP